MKNVDRFIVFISILGVLTSVASLGFIATPSSLGLSNFFYNFNLDVIEKLMTGVLGSFIGALIAVLVARSHARRKAPSVFISYRHENRDIAKKIANEIRKVSDHVWIDDLEINIGDSIREKIESGLKNSDYFLILLSEESSRNQWSEIELAKAMELGKAIFPVKIDDSEIPEAIKNIAYADLRGSFDAGVDKLKRALVSASHNKAAQRTSR